MVSGDIGNRLPRIARDARAPRESARTWRFLAAVDAKAIDLGVARWRCGEESSAAIAPRLQFFLFFLVHPVTEVSSEASIFRFVIGVLIPAGVFFFFCGRAHI